MKLGPTIKLHKINTTTLKKKKKKKKIDNDAMLENCDVTVILLIYGQFGAILKSDTGS